MKSSKTAKRFLAIALAFVMAVTTALFEPVKVRAEAQDPGEGGRKLLVKMTSSLRSVTWNSGTRKNAKFTIRVNIKKEGFTNGVKLGEFYASTKPFTNVNDAMAIMTPQVEGDTLPLSNEDGSTTFIYGGMPGKDGATLYWMNEDEVKNAAAKARSDMNQVLFAGKDLGHVAFEKSGNNTQVADALNAKLEQLMEKVGEAFAKMNPGEYNGPDVVVDDYDFEGAKKALDEVKPILTETMEYAKTVSGVTEEDITKMNGFLNDANDAIETAKASIDATAALLPQEGSTVYVGASVFVPGDDGNDVEVLIGTLPVTYGKTTDAESVAEKPKHKLTVQYICKDKISADVQIPDQVIEEVEEGKEYSVETPAIVGLTPSQTVVQGTMGTEDVTVVITYTVDKCNVSFETNGGTEIERPAVFGRKRRKAIPS